MAAAAAGHEWQRPFDPFGSEAVDIITQLTPSKTTQLSPAQQSAAAASPAHTADEAEDGADHDSDAFMDRLNASALQPQSLALSTSVAAPASIAAPQRQRGSRATIYEDDEEAHCSSQEDSALPPPPPPRMPRFPPTPSTASPASASVPSLLRPLQRQQQRTPVTGQRSHAWTQHADDADAVLLTKKAVARPVRSGREPSTLREGERSAHLPAALASPAGEGESGAGGTEFGFTSGSGKRVAVSAAALARGAQMMREVEEEEASRARASGTRAAAGDEDAPLRSIGSANSNTHALRTQTATTASQSPAVMPSASPTAAPGFKTLVRVPRPASGSATPHRLLPSAADAEPALHAVFTSARDAPLPTVSAASLARAKERMDRADAEVDSEFARPPDCRTPFRIDAEVGEDGTADADAEREVGFFTGNREAIVISEEALSSSRKRFSGLAQDAHEEETLPEEGPAEASAESLWTKVGWTTAAVQQSSSPVLRPPSSTFKAPARQAPRRAVPSAELAPLVDPPSAAAVDGGASVRPSRRADKSERLEPFEAFMAALGDADAVDDALNDDSLLPLPKPSGLPAAEGEDEADHPFVGFQTAAAAASVDGAESDNFPSFSSSSTGLSSSPFTPSERRQYTEQRPPTDAQGGFQTGRGGDVHFSADSWAKGQRLIDSVEKKPSDAGDDPSRPLRPPPPRPPLAPIAGGALNARGELDEPALLTKRNKENVPIAQRRERAASHSLPPRPSPPLSASKSSARPFRPPVAIARPSIIESPVQSPGTGIVQHHLAQRRPPIEDGDASTTKKRRLAFNTPRAHVTANTVVRPGQGDDEEEPNLLKSAKKARAAATALQKEMSKHADLSAPVPPLPSLEPPSSLLPFYVPQHVIEQHSEDELLAMGLPEEVVRMTATTALSYTFPPSASSGGVRLSAVHAYHQLVQLSCDPSLFSLLWVRNHWRWVVWKLAAYERTFPSVLAGRCLTYFQVMRQIKRRYDRELDQVKRSALALILERDESASRYLVLCIAAITGDAVEAEDDPNADDPDTAILLHTATAFRKSCHLVLTDGHYSVPAKLDPPLLSLLHRGRLRVGCTLRVFNSSLGGGADAVTPLENESVYLELHANSVRRGRPGCKLGFQRSSTFSVSLRGVAEGGGGLPCVHAAVGRVSPMVFMEMMEDGTKLHRTQRAEEAADQRWRERIDIRMEQRRMDWEAALDKANSASESQQNGGLSSTFSSSSQGQDEAAMDEEPIEPRKVIPYIKVRLHEVVPPGASPPIPQADGGEIADDGEAGNDAAHETALLSGCECTLTVWRPSEADLETLVEGTAVSLYGAQVSGRFDGVLRLANSRSTPIVRMQGVGPFPSLCRRAVPFSGLQALQAGEEFDCAMNVVYESRHESPVWSTATRHLFGVHDTEELLMVELVESASLVHLPANALQLPVVALFTGLKYGNYDRVRRVHVAHATVTSQVRSRGGGGGDGGHGGKALQSAWSNCREWFDTTAGERVRSMQRERVRRLVEGNGADGGGGETEEWYARLRRAIFDTESEKAQRPAQRPAQAVKLKQQLAIGKSRK